MSELRSLFPWFGGKRDAAPYVWAALGDVHHYVEPFFGSGAVLLARPHPVNRVYHSETVNDADCLLANFWRALAADPDGVAEAASWPVSEADYHARTLALLEWRESGTRELIMGTADWYDVKMAGWWVWVVCSAIGLGGRFSGDGKWVRGEDGKIRLREKKENENKSGIYLARPNLIGGGQGVNRPQYREPGISFEKPHLSNDGRGVNRPQYRKEGVAINEVCVEEIIAADYEASFGFHPMVMPDLRREIRRLAARLRHVRILCGDWTRVLGGGVLMTLPVRRKNGCAGIFFDPPYSAAERDNNLYAVDTDVAAEVRKWCKEHGDNPSLRIVLAGYVGEGHEELEECGWRCVPWFKGGFLKGGMGLQSVNGHQQHRERLWLSPHCLPFESASDFQPSLFGE